MYDSSGNGGIYREASSRWYQYYLVSNDCTGFGTSTTNSAYNIYCPKGIYSGGRVDGTIFYDSDDTGFYVNPNGTSRIRRTDLIASGSGWDDGLNLYSSDQSNRWNFLVDNGDSDSLRIAYNNSEALRINTSRNVTANVDFRAPIFYDSNDTTYYVDPATFTNLYGGMFMQGAHSSTQIQLQLPAGNNGAATGNVRLAMWCSEPGVTWDYAGFGYNVINDGGSPGGFSRINTNFGQAYMRFSTAGDLIFYNTNTSGTRVTTMSFNNVGEVTTYQGLYVPIMYDSNNTAYYVNPASTSNLSDVQAVFLESSNSIEMRSSVSGTYPAFLVNQYADVTIYRGNGTTAYIGFSNDNVAYLYNDGTNFIFSGRGLQATSFGVGTAPSGTTGEIRATNNITAYYSSDIKFKTNVRDIPNAIETVESIGGKLFDWNDEYIEEHGGEDGYFVQKEDFGVIAQDVQKVFPVAVRTRPDGSLAVDYEKLSALAFAAVAELSTRVKSLEARI
jgi:hypothetical protein